MPSFVPAFAVMLLVLFSSGCGWRRVALPELKGLHRADSEQYAKFTEDLKAAQEGVRTGRVLSTAVLSGRLGRTVAFKQVTIFSYPDRFRQQFFATNLNAPAFIVLVRGGEFEAFDFQSRRGFRGPVTLENARKVLTVPLYPEEWMFWLSGRFAAPPAGDVISDELMLDADGNIYVYRVALGDGRVFKAYLKKDNLRLTALELGYLTQKEPVFISAYAYREGSDYPTAISFDLLEEHVSGRLEIQQTVFNRPFSEAENRTLFAPPLPAGAEFMPLDQLPENISAVIGTL